MRNNISIKQTTNAHLLKAINNASRELVTNSQLCGEKGHQLISFNVTGILFENKILVDVTF